VLKFNYILLLFVVLNCKPSSLKNYKDSCEEINVLMYEQEESWNKGNIEDFMKKYWRNDSLIFIGKSGINYGWNKTTSNYKKSYPSQNLMGLLHFNNIKCLPINDTTHIISGQWNIFRLDSSKNVGGYYSLMWIKKEDGWRIVYDHTS
jgi:hypothetical protein